MLDVISTVTCGATVTLDARLSIVFQSSWTSIKPTSVGSPGALTNSISNESPALTLLTGTLMCNAETRERQRAKALETCDGQWEDEGKDTGRYTRAWQTCYRTGRNEIASDAGDD